MSKRRVPPPGPAPAETPAGMRPLVALAISALVVAVAVGAGAGIDRALGHQPAGAFSRCQTATQLAPSLFSGPPPMCIDTSAKYSGTIKTTKGDVNISFLTSQAPKTVNNFVVLAEHGFFDGQTFWRSEDWVVQSGDPQNNGRGGPGYTIPPEPTPTSDQWPPGSLGMARFPDGSISGSQFFILKQAWPGGNPTAAYNHFATVTTGLDVVSQLTTSDTILSVAVRRG